MRTDGQWYWAEYSTFSISDEVGKYQLTVDGYSGDAGDAMAASAQGLWNSNGKEFSTPDSDNDDAAGYWCAADHNVGWWYRWCSAAAINNDDLGLWSTVAVVDVQSSRMMIKVD